MQKHDELMERIRQRHDKSPKCFLFEYKSEKDMQQLPTASCPDSSNSTTTEEFCVKLSW
ncbi:hypothetical protein DPMN_185381 [Dreissena polymorpha]|uniref:Uncharacterized protein n=1 Tax=Dreissena polymorpha TaxID=45954 RepID=A0A9D4DKD4_DREPO|nr:hypothetical protein DPMN_185381 [Dreissena polymorpha]